MNASAEPLGAGRFLTIADAAEVLSVSTREVDGLVRSGELPAIRVGARGTGAWRIERSVLEGYIEALYEESRRRGLWRQSNIASVAELAFGEPPVRRSR